jgi:hypothetical protein
MATVYEIRNRVNGKVYVGRTIKAAGVRKTQHWSDLRAGRHHNIHLQRAWNLYGEDAFRFDAVIELDCPEAEILDIEEQRTLRLRAELGRENVYTIRAGGQNPMSNPEVRERSKTNTRTAMQRPEVRERLMVGVARREEKRKSSDEYVSAQEARQLEKEQRNARWRENLRQGAIERNKEGAKTYIGFVSPGGEVYTPVTNLNEFCREHGLPQGEMWRLATGNRGTKSYKGWIRYEPEIVDD